MNKGVDKQVDGLETPEERKERLKHLPRQAKHPNLLAGGIPGHEGRGGRPPNKLREFCRETYDQIVQELGPACLTLAKAINSLAQSSEDSAEAAKTLERFRQVGWNPEQVIKVSSGLRDAGLPKQSEIVLSNDDVLKVVAECIGKVYGPGRVAECVDLITEALG